MGIAIGPFKTRNRVFLAPMSGVSDAPFRASASQRGAGLVLSEMVAGDALVQARPDMVARATTIGDDQPFCIQLAGREAHWMAEGARVAQDLGADLIDINMGCPARMVTGALSGSALMRNLDHALTLIDATVAASKVPVSVKMRLGWDDDTRNAPELAARAEAAGVAMITVHGRTRCQFYAGKADWPAIRAVRERISIPLIANGDCRTVDDARAMLEQSGADGVMIGRGAYGRPWWPGVIAEGLEPGTGRAAPTLAEDHELLVVQYEAMLSLYGTGLGNRIARKHLGWTVERYGDDGCLATHETKDWKARLQGQTEAPAVLALLRDLWARLGEGGARPGEPAVAPLC